MLRGTSSGTRHGKGSCDREYGTPKKGVNDRVKTRRVDLLSASDFYTFCAENFTRGEEEHCHYKRSFWGVPKDVIMWGRQRTVDLKALPTTRKQHAIKMLRPFVVAVRERSCSCPQCTGKQPGCCQNADLTGHWTQFTLRNVVSKLVCCQIKFIIVFIWNLSAIRLYLFFSLRTLRLTGLSY